MQVSSISPSLGSIINGLDLSQDLSDNLISDLRTLWLERQVLVIRAQALCPSQYISIAQKFGVPDIYPFLNGLPEFPEITPILKKENETSNFGGVWHSDTTYQPTRPWQPCCML